MLENDGNVNCYSKVTFFLFNKGWKLFLISVIGKLVNNQMKHKINNVVNLYIYYYL